MNRTIFVGLSLIVSLLVKPIAARAEKYAAVDFQRAMEETEDGKKAKAKLKVEFDRKQKELNDRQEEVKKMKEALEKKAQMMKPEALVKEQKELQDNFVKLQEVYARLQQDLAQKEQDATRGIISKLSAIVTKIAERNNFTLVFEKNSLVYFQPSLDITNEVIRTYNSESGTKK